MILRCQGLLASSQIVQISIQRFIYYTPDTNTILWFNKHPPQSLLTQPPAAINFMWPLPTSLCLTCKLG